MPMIRPMSDLTTHAQEIADFCRETMEPVLITHTGGERLVLMSAAAYERRQAQTASYVQTAGRASPAPADGPRESLLLAARQLWECLAGID